MHSHTIKYFYFYLNIYQKLFIIVLKYFFKKKKHLKHVLNTFYINIFVSVFKNNFKVIFCATERRSDTN